MELNQKESALMVHTQDDGKWKRLNNSKYELWTIITYSNIYYLNIIVLTFVLVYKLKMYH